MALDIARMSMAITGQETGRKILTVMVSLLELLRGDWKKALLTFMGYYGMNPTLFGQFGKALLTGFRMFSPDLQDQFVFGSLDAAKSFMIGILLTIFQVTAPEEVRLPLIASLEEIAKRKAQMDGVLESEKLSARPNYLSPTFEDLNNIQAVMVDPAYICSCEFEELIKSVDQTTMIRVVLQLLRIPVTAEFRKLKCGAEPCHPFVKEVVEESEEEKEIAKEAFTPLPIEEESKKVEEPVEQVEPVEPVGPMKTSTNTTTNVPPTTPTPLETNASVPPKQEGGIHRGGRVLHVMSKFKQKVVSHKNEDLKQ
jgi:hypothetical protein